MPEEKQHPPEEKKTVEVDQDNKGKVVNVDNLPITKMKISLALFSSLMVGTITIVFLVAQRYYILTHEIETNKEKIEVMSERFKRYEESKEEKKGSDAILANLKDIQVQDCDFYSKSIECLTEKKRLLNCK